MGTDVGVPPQTCIVVEVFEYQGTPEEAAQAIQESNAHRETQTFVYAAPSLSELSHPMQVQEISQHFEDKGMLDKQQST